MYKIVIVLGNKEKMYFKINCVELTNSMFITRNWSQKLN